MKNGKKFFALVLGLALTVSGLSVSAAGGALRVREEAAAVTLYENDFETAPEEDGRITARNVSFDAAAKALKLTSGGSVVSIYFNKNHSGLSGTVTAEYTVRLASAPVGNQVQMHLLNQSGAELTDMRVYDGSYMVLLSGDASQAESVQLKLGSNELTYKVMYNNITRQKSVWINGTQILNETGGYLWDRWYASAEDIAGLRIATSTDCEVYLEAVSFGIAATEGAPTAGEELFYEDFEDETVDTSKFTRLNSDVCSIENGALVSTAANGDVPWMLNLGENITGEYVAEAVLSGSTTGAYHRLNFSTGDRFYVYYDAVNAGYRRFELAGRPQVIETGLKTKDYKAASSMKISVYYNTNSGRQALYFNDVKVWEDTYAADVMSEALMNGMYLNQYGGEIRLESVRVYRPLSGMVVTMNDANVVTIQTRESQKVQVAAATFEEDAGATKLNAVGACTLTLEPNMVYTADLKDYTGGRFFLWDSAIKPLCASVNLD